MKILITVLLLAGIIGLYGGKIKTYGNELMPIKYVRAEGVFQYISKDEIRSVLMPLVKTGIMAADMQAIHDTVAKLPWVETVSVKRVWPDAITIKLREKKAFARWGDKSLITEQGEIFKPNNMDQFGTMVTLKGPESQHAKTLEIMKGVSTALADQALEMTEFDINERGSWKIRLASDLEILLGRNDQLKKLQRFLKTLPVLGHERIEAMAVVDLRYPNGFAVSWRPGSKKINWVKMANPEKQTKGIQRKR